MFADVGQMLSRGPPLDAVVICTPPQTHYQIARSALLAGKHVLLEKPPCTSLAQFDHLKGLANDAGVSLYQTWHSQHAAGVTPALSLLHSRKILGVRALWKEDVRRWHPGQKWIWEAGGFGVLDAGINAISIITKLIDEPMFPAAATLFVPSNCQTPIAADATLQTPSGVAIKLDFDFRQIGEQTWDIEIDTDVGPMRLSAGGGLLFVDKDLVPGDSAGLCGEYKSIYRRFADLVLKKQSDTDVRPFSIVADIVLTANRVIVEPFIE